MVTLTETLNRISDWLCKPLHISPHALELDAEMPEDEDEINESLEDAFVFDIREATEEDIQWVVEDQFNDGYPEGLELDKKVPFALIGYIELEEGETLGKGNFDAVRQPNYMLLLDIENGVPGKVPVYRVDIDGTVMPDSLQLIAHDIADLPFRAGYVED